MAGLGARGGPPAHDDPHGVSRKERTLQPGESHTLQFPWDQIHYQTDDLVDRGIYRIYVSSVLESGSPLQFADLFVHLE